jgi:putative NADPH-quinone reductase
MKIVVINGSPKGKDGNTNVLVNAFLKGANNAGAKSVNIYISEKRIEHCMGCHICWTKGPGQCVISDDVLSVLMEMGDADVIAFSSPVYFENISGMLKTFMDRMTMIGGPQQQKSIEEEKDLKSSNVQGPKLMMISSCGHLDESEFSVTSHWINRIAEKMHMELVGEIYFSSGKYLKETPEELKEQLSNYLQLVEKAGSEIGKNFKLSDNTKKFLKENIIIRNK